MVITPKSRVFTLLLFNVALDISDSTRKEVFLMLVIGLTALLNKPIDFFSMAINPSLPICD